MKSVTLINLGGPFTANLPHDQYCARTGVCACTVTHQGSLVITAEGERGKRVEPKKVNASIHINAGGKLEGLNPAVLQVPEVKAALKAGTLKKEFVDKDAPKVATSTTGAATAAETKTPEKKANEPQAGAGEKGKPKK